MAPNVFCELKNRNFIYQTTDEEKIPSLLDSEKISFYTGFDPTGDSLHVGHLLPVMAMRILQKAGHTPIVLVGGATALVGDPSGKQEARPIISKEQVEHNAEAIRKQLAKFISLENGKALFVNNAEWFLDLRYIDFLRDIGSRFSVNRMLTAESVKQRLETGLSFLEFNYMILQAYDFHILNSKHNCRLQLGGQDQWGNIVAGVELVRRLSQNEVFGMTFPLLLNKDGHKFGKTAAGAVWLDPNKTSIFDYYQFWRNCDDADVMRLLGFFTTLPLQEISDITSSASANINRAKEILAYEATSLAHGKDEAEKAFVAAGSKFGFADPDNKIRTSSLIHSVDMKKGSGLADLPTYSVLKDELQKGIWIVKLLTDSGLASSNGEARRLIQGGGAYINDMRIDDMNKNITPHDLKEGFAIIKAGKKNVRRITIA